MLQPELLNPRDLRPYKLNAKLHPPEQIEKIVRSIQLTGFDQPIVVDRDLVVIKGHGRLLAALDMNLDSVPVIVLDVSKDVADKARLIDNKSAESGYDIELLLKELTRFSNDLDDTGYNSEDLDRLLEDINQDLEGMTNSNSNTKEIDVNDFEFDHKCPKCGFEF